MRSLPFYPLMVLILVGLGGYLGCDPNSIQVPLETAGGLKTASSSSQHSASIPPRTAGTILIGSFNLQRLGPKKLGDAWVMEKFAEIIRCFDVIALQEITSLDQQTIPALVAQVNRSGAQYSYTLSPRIGRAATGYFEQYAFLFDTNRIRSGPEFSYVVQDDADMLHREPFVGRFESISAGQPFTFTLINVHTDPDEIKVELDVLADVYINVRQFEYPEDDVMLLGDLNAEPDQFQRLSQIPAFLPLISDLPTNTRKSRTIDNILADSQTTREFTGRSGTIDLQQMFRIELSDAERISDHLPVWAEFTIAEKAGGYGATATTSPGLVR